MDEKQARLDYYKIETETGSKSGSGSGPESLNAPKSARTMSTASGANSVRDSEGNSQSNTLSSSNRSTEQSQSGDVADDEMDKLQDEIDTVRAQSTKQGMLVRQLKKDGASKDQVVAEVEKLQQLKQRLATLESKLKGPEFDRETFDRALVRRLIFVPAFEIHNSVAGLFDFGPVGVGLKDAIIAEWKKHFVLEESMLQVECPNLTPYSVLQTSGHVERFSDLMVKDTVNGECYRADKLLEDHIENVIKDQSATLSPERKAELEKIARMADGYTAEEIDELFKPQQLDVRSPSSGSPLSPAFPFNLMFQTTIGPEGNTVGYLRPETAQGIFTMFRRLLESNYSQMPFAAAQVGTGFRNEISPKNGLLRVREFSMAEIEHFVDPQKKEHPKFKDVADYTLSLFPAINQTTDGKLVKMKIGDAVANGVVANETLGYFIVRTHMFLCNIGISPKRLRFRQHLSTEMAHYASDCWDAEILLTYGWTECVGLADRACYDLEQHTKKTKVELMATRFLDEPRIVQELNLKENSAKLGSMLRKDKKIVTPFLSTLDDEKKVEIENTLEKEGKVTIGPIGSEEVESLRHHLLESGVPAKLIDESPFMNNGATYELSRDHLKFETVDRKVTEEKYYPSVIEPSFGIGRILHAVLEHNFYVREEEGGKEDDGKLKRSVFSFPSNVAPIKCGVGALLRKDFLESEARKITNMLIQDELKAQYDGTSAAIGRKYARADEIGIPYFVTVDMETVKDNAGVTLRERDSQRQIRLPIDDVVPLVAALCKRRKTWKDAEQLYPVVKE